MTQLTDSGGSCDQLKMGTACLRNHHQQPGSCLLDPATPCTMTVRLSQFITSQRGLSISSMPPLRLLQDSSLNLHFPLSSSSSSSHVSPHSSL